MAVHNDQSRITQQGIDTIPLGKAAVIVGIHLPDDDADSEEDLNELSLLLRTLNIPEKARVIQKRSKLNAKCLIGEGKAEEIKELALEQGADMIVFDRPLTGPQVQNLEKICELAVFDRTGIILEIFSRHARTKQAKTQVEIAQLEYILPRLSGAWSHFQRQKGGGVSSRGMGEKQIEVDRRRARERISRLQQKLSGIDKECQTRRKGRSFEWKVALVGYTNSGKTTIMKGLTKSERDGENALFATLDTRIKTIDPKTRPKILISDTVGFIRNLPHRLIESFKSTLDEVKEADLLLHVIDISHANYRSQMATTEKVLQEIGAGDIPTYYIFNKQDLLDDPVLPRVLKGAYPESTVMCGNDQGQIELLRDKINNKFQKTLESATLVVPLDDQETQSFIFANCLITQSDYSIEDRAVFFVKSTIPVLERLRNHVDMSPGASIIPNRTESGELP